MIPKDPPDRYDRYGFRIENYDLYKPKKYYIEPENEEELKKKLDALENELKQYKHHEDLQRIFPDSHPYGKGIYVFEEYLWAGLIVSPIIGGLYSRYVYGTARTRWTATKYSMGFYLGYSLLAYVHYRLDARSQPQNTGIFDVMPEEKRLQNHFDYELDLYRNIDKLKYTDKHVTDAQAKEKKKEMVEKRKDIRVRIYKEHGYKFLPRESFSYKY